MRPAVFLDRDDTLMVANALPPPAAPAAPGDVADPALVRLLPGAADACRKMREGGLELIVFSNQGVVARGGASCEVVEAVNARLEILLEREAGWDRGARGALIRAFFYCPYHPRGSVPEFTREHPWRKPGPGMILAAAAEHGLDLSRSWVIGDAVRDTEAGIAAGIPRGRCLLVGPARDIGAAAATILDAAKREAPGPATGRSS